MSVTSPSPSPQPEDDQEEAEAEDSPGPPQAESPRQPQRQLGLGDHPVTRTVEALAGPEERHEAGGVDLVQDGEGEVRPQDGGQLEVDLDCEGDAELVVDVEVNVVFLIVGGGCVGQQGVGGGVEAVREGDREGRPDVWVAGLQAEVAAGQAEAGLGAVAGGLVQAVLLGLVPRHGDVLDGEVLHRHHVHSPAHDGQHHGETLTEPRRQTAGLQAAGYLVTAGVLLPGTKRSFAVNIKDFPFRSEVCLPGKNPATTSACYHAAQSVPSIT